MRPVEFGVNSKRSIQNTPLENISPGNHSRGKKTSGGLPRVSRKPDCRPNRLLKEAAPHSMATAHVQLGCVCSDDRLAPECLLLALSGQSTRTGVCPLPDHSGQILILV